MQLIQTSVYVHTVIPPWHTRAQSVSGQLTDGGPCNYQTNHRIQRTFPELKEKEKLMAYFTLQ